MKTDPPELEKQLGSDLKLIEKLPVKTKELSALMDQSEKTSGKERAVITKSIQDKSE